MKKYLKYLGYGLIVFVIIGIIAVATDSSDAKKADQPMIPYEVTKAEKSYTQFDYRITIKERASKEQLIAIVHKLKADRNLDGQVVAFFDLNAHSPSSAWAAVSYLPECPECETDKDPDGNPVEYRLIGMTKSHADSLEVLRLDTIPEKHLLASYLEDIFKCKTEIYFVPAQPSKLLMARLFLDGGKLLEWLNKKEVDGETRYYFDDEEPGKENYMVLDNHSKVANFKDVEDKLWMAYGFK